MYECQKGHACVLLWPQGVRADRHYRHQLLGAALVGLQANVVTAHAHTRLAAVQLARRRHFLLVRVLDEWRGVAQSRARLRRLGSELAARHAQAVRRGVLRVWCQWQWQRPRKDRQELQVQAHAPSQDAQTPFSAHVRHLDIR